MDEIPGLYPKEYGSLSAGIKKAPEAVRLARIWQDQSFLGRLNALLNLAAYRSAFNRSLPIQRDSSSLLDVGCGNGFFLLVAKRLGYSVHGVEPSDFDETLNKSEGLGIFHGFIENASFKEGQFDVITANHVLEHAVSPAKLLLDIKKLAKPGGTIIIAVPNTCSPGFMVFGKYWLNTDTPRHLFLPSANNMREYARKAGLKIDRMYSNVTPGTYLDSLRYLIEEKTGEPFHFPRFLSKLLVLLLLIPVEMINLAGFGDNIEIIMRKV
jgi:2-polyprenyl-3-methyl-5-hydroxy-6-metoxy-1,4-benzoquinol methylase